MSFTGNRPPREDLERLCEKMCVTEIAAYYSTEYKTAWQWLVNFNLRPQPGRRLGKKEVNIDVDYVKKCLQQGITLVEIAKHFHVSTQTLRSRIRGMDIGEDGGEAGNHGFNCRYSGKGRHDCKYWSKNCQCCDYIGVTGHKRPCPPNNCTVYEKGGRPHGFKASNFY